MLTSQARPTISFLRVATRFIRAFVVFWAWLTVCATFALLFLGSIVTTFRVGMADPIWPTAPWHLLIIDWQEPSAGFLIEHSHRLAGYIVGCCTIVLVLSLLLNASLAWVSDAGQSEREGVQGSGGLALMSGVALLAVIIQGLL